MFSPSMNKKITDVIITYTNDQKKKEIQIIKKVYFNRKMRDTRENTCGHGKQFLKEDKKKNNVLEVIFMFHTRSS